MPEARRKKRNHSSQTTTRKPRSNRDSLLELQTLFSSVVTRPLTTDWKSNPTWKNGEPTERFVSGFIKPNSRLTSLDRIELYNRQYWYRLIDVMYEDYPGVAAILGEGRFRAFCEAYLTAHPSASGLLRNLGRHLAKFIPANPSLTGPDTKMVHDMALFEWAQVEAFDAGERLPLAPANLQGRNPAVTRLRLQPYITLLELDFAVDQFLIAVKRQTLRSEASNASTRVSKATHTRRRRAKQERVHLVVHRADNLVYAKRIAPEAYAILSALQRGDTIAAAVESALSAATSHSDNWPELIRHWFSVWMSFGWFCRPHSMRQ